MSLSLSEILSLPPENRRRRRIPTTRGKSKKRRRKYEMGRKFSEEEIVQYLVENDIRSSAQLDRERGNYEPSVYDCRKVFGSWQNAKEAAFGGEMFDTPSDAEYILRSIVEFDVWTYRRYLRVRKLRPDIFPSYHQILSQWGRFSTLIYYAKRYSMKECLESYLRLWRSLGKKPTLADCKKKNISLESAIDVWGDKKSLDDFLSGIMRSQNAK